VAKIPCLHRVNGGPWGMRRRVPKDLVGVLGQTEIVYSYHTDNFREASRRHPHEMAKVQAQFDEERRKLAEEKSGGNILPATLLPVPREEDVRDGVNAWLHAQLRKDQLEQVPTASERDAIIDNLRIEQAELSDEEGRRWAARHLPKIMGEFGFGSPPKEVEALAVSLLQRAVVEAVRRDLDRFEGNLGEVVYDPAFAKIIGVAPSPPAPQPRGVAFGDLCDLYLSTPDRRGLAPKTKLKYQGMFRVLRDLLGAGTEAASISRSDCRRAQEVLMTIPANAMQRYPGKTAQQAAAGAKRDGVPPMKSASVGNHLELLAALFRWGITETLVRMPDGNPAEGLNASTSKTVVATAGEKRRPFTAAELQVIFATPLYTGCVDDETGYSTAGRNHPRRGRFWVPLLGLFAGLRLNEACQLRLADVVEEEGVPVLRIQAKGEFQRLKTQAAERKVPVHPELIRIGLLAHCKKLRSVGEERLFPELPLGKMGNFSDPFSKWFARFLEKAGVNSPEAVFHSFRHGFRDRLREAGVPSEIADSLGGWAISGQGAKYGLGYSARKLADHVERITYPNIDFSFLHQPD